MTKQYVEPETLRATCPECAYECELGTDNSNDVCEHFVKFKNLKFVFNGSKQYKIGKLMKLEEKEARKVSGKW
jgi:hypothetical protein